MRLRFHNVGIVKEIDINLNSPLTIFTGPNGTGKTYVSYLLSQLPSSMGGTFLSMIRRDKDERISRLFPLEALKNEVSISGELDCDLLYEVFKDALSIVSRGILEDANLAFSEHVAKDFFIELLTSIDDWREEIEKSSFSVGYAVKFIKHSNSNRYSFEVAYSDSGNEDSFLQALSLNALFFGGCVNSMMFTAERTGIALFSKELALGRLKDNSREKINRYPSAISDGLVFAEDRSYIMKHVSPMSRIAELIEERIIKGEMLVSEDGEMQFKYGQNIVDLPISSSSSKALGDFLFYLKHHAEAQSMVVVDEPEIHLHPDNQIVLARIFANMVNQGMRVVITTHSDYIIREINNLIMLHSIGKGIKQEALELGYSADEYLNYQDVCAYLFDREEDHIKVSPLKVSGSGFSVSSIDHVIGRINEISERLYLALMSNR